MAATDTDAGKLGPVAALQRRAATTGVGARGVLRDATVRELPAAGRRRWSSFWRRMAVGRANWCERQLARESATEAAAAKLGKPRRRRWGWSARTAPGTSRRWKLQGSVSAGRQSLQHVQRRTTRTWSLADPKSKIWNPKSKIWNPKSKLHQESSFLTNQHRLHHKSTSITLQFVLQTWPSPTILSVTCYNPKETKFLKTNKQSSVTDHHRSWPSLEIKCAFQDQKSWCKSNLHFIQDNKNASTKNFSKTLREKNLVWFGVDATKCNN